MINTNKAKIHKNGKWALPFVVISALVFTAHGGLRLLVQLYLQDLNCQPIIISMTTSLASLGLLLGSTFWGALSDSHRERPLMWVILVTSGIGVGSLAFLLPVAGVFLSVFLFVFMAAGVGPIAMAIASKSGGRNKRGRNLSLVTSARSFGFMAGGALAGFLLVLAGFRYSFVVFAALPLVAVLVVGLIPQQRKENEDGRESSLHSLVERHGLRSLYIATVLRQMGTTGWASLIFVYMVTIGIPKGPMGAASALNHAVQVFGMLLFGFLADQLGRKGVFLFGFGLSAIVPFIFVFTASITGMSVGFFCLGVAFSSLYVGSAAHIGDRISSREQGSMLGLFESSRGLGGVLGPILAGVITPIVGFQGMFLTMGAISGLAFMLVLLTEVSQRKIA